VAITIETAGEEKVHCVWSKTHPIYHQARFRIICWRSEQCSSTLPHVIALVGWLNRHQQAVTDYLIEENRVLIARRTAALVQQ
jgi:hypothetical protein